MALSRTLSDLLEQDKIAKFTKTGNTTATLGSLTLNTATSGAGGLDTGTIAASTFYYVYTVVSNNAIKLVASTSAISPTGFTQYKKVGAFYTDTSSNIFKAYFYGEVNMTVFSARIPSAGGVIGESFGFISSCTAPGTGYTCTFVAGLFTLTPNCTVTGYTNGFIVSIASNSLSSVNIRFAERSDGGGLNMSSGFNIFCQKTGVDATSPDWSRV